MEDLSFKPGYQPWNEEEFWSDILVQSWPRHAAHLYKALCNAAFFCSTRPYLPANDLDLCMLSHAESMEEWLKYKPLILKKFKRKKLRGKWILWHKRIEHDWLFLRGERKRLSEQGRLGGRKTQAQARLKRGLTSVKAVSEVKSVSEVSEVSQEEHQGGEDMAIQKKQTQKRLGQILARTWQEVKRSRGAVCPYPRGGFQSSFESLAEAHDHEIIIKAFELWANDVGEPDRISFPIEEFMKEISTYMLKADPVKERIETPEEKAKREAQEKCQADFETEAGGALGTTINKRPDEGPVVTDLSQLD